MAQKANKTVSTFDFQAGMVVKSPLAGFVTLEEKLQVGKTTQAERAKQTGNFTELWRVSKEGKSFYTPFRSGGMYEVQT